jgi:murein DD-endopeptidase MepM/ murein hydrolase activator NlpD
MENKSQGGGCLIFIIIIVLFSGTIFFGLLLFSNSDLQYLSVNNEYFEKSLDNSDSLDDFCTILSRVFVQLKNKKDLEKYNEKIFMDALNNTIEKAYSEKTYKTHYKKIEGVFSGIVGNYEEKRIEHEEEINNEYFNCYGVYMLLVDKNGKRYVEDPDGHYADIGGDSYLYVDNKKYFWHNNKSMVRKETTETIEVVYWDKKFGLKGFFPLSKGTIVIYNNDFGNKRNYGSDHRHKGNDMFALPGSPLIAVESGTVTEKGWDNSGGWYIKIKSDDDLRIYYYAHMKKHYENLDVNDRVTAGDVVGYCGSSGYGDVDTANKFLPHLHIEIRYVYNTERNKIIKLNPFYLNKFLSNNKMKTIKSNGVPVPDRTKRPVD